MPTALDTATPSSATSAAIASSRPQAPDVAAPSLFRAVQTAQLFPDQKQFVDMEPQMPLAAVEAEYVLQRQRADFDLRAFVAARFKTPVEHRSPPLPADQSLTEHINALWPILTRDSRKVSLQGSQLALPKPYVVPGGRFGELYYWDSYFTMLGLQASGEAQRSSDMLANFAYLIDAYGHIPNGTRSYYLSRSQPPFFSHMVALEAQSQGPAGGEAALLQRYLPQLRAEHRYWMRGAEGLAPGQARDRVVRLADGSLLNRYWDDLATPRPESYLQDVETAREAASRPAAEVWRDLRAGAESGWDYSSRWLADRRHLHTIRTTAIVPVDLNSLMLHLESTIAKACRAAADAACVTEFGQRAQARGQAIERTLWNPTGFYADYDWQRGQVSEQLTAAALFPLFVGSATPDRARSTARAIEGALVRPGGLLTTAAETGQQWDSPNAWAPLQWVAVSGLQRYGEATLAERIGRGFLSQVQSVYAREHKLVEKYDIASGRGGGGGEYPLQDGFGWTNGVTMMLLSVYPMPGTPTPGRPATQRSSAAPAAAPAVPSVSKATP